METLVPSRGTDPRPRAFQARALPIELRRRNLERMAGLEPAASTMAWSRAARCATSAKKPHRIRIVKERGAPGPARGPHTWGRGLQSAAPQSAKPGDLSITRASIAGAGSRLSRAQPSFVEGPGEWLLIGKGKAPADDGRVSSDVARVRARRPAPARALGYRGRVGFQSRFPSVGGFVGCFVTGRILRARFVDCQAFGANIFHPLQNRLYFGLVSSIL